MLPHMLGRGRCCRPASPALKPPPLQQVGCLVMSLINPIVTHNWNVWGSAGSSCQTMAERSSLGGALPPRTKRLSTQLCGHEQGSGRSLRYSGTFMMPPGTQRTAGRRRRPPCPALPHQNDRCGYISTCTPTRILCSQGIQHVWGRSCKLSRAAPISWGGCTVRVIQTHPVHSSVVGCKFQFPSRAVWVLLPGGFTKLFGLSTAWMTAFAASGWQGMSQ